MTTFIYKLIDPRDGLVRYVGKANKPRTRLYRHIQAAKNNSRKTRVCAWVKTLLNNNLVPIMEIIEECNFEIWESREQYWIAFYQHEKLTNLSPGGEGIKGYKWTEERKEKQRLRMLGKPGAMKGRKQSVETRKLISDASKSFHANFKKEHGIGVLGGRKHSPERKPISKKPYTHGTAAGYRRKCRCELCILAMRKHERIYNKIKNTAQKHTRNIHIKWFKQIILESFQKGLLGDRLSDLKTAIAGAFHKGMLSPSPLLRE